MKTQVTTEQRLLLKEDKRAIEYANESASERAKLLNSISKVFSFESEEEFNQRTKDINKMVQSAMLKDPKVKELANQVELSAIKVPQYIAEAKETVLNLIDCYKNNLFNHLTLEDGKWIPNSDELESFAESQRLYAVGETEIAKYEMAKQLADFQNKYGMSGIYGYQRIDYDHILINWSGSKWVPNLNYITSR